MYTRAGLHRLALTVMGAVTLGFTAAPAYADAPVALPTAPGADRAAVDPTAARASLPGDNGSPVEPYLFLFILAGGGIIGVGFATVTDRRLRAAGVDVRLRKQLF